MDKNAKITFLESSFGDLEAAEEKLKELNLRIAKQNDDIKRLREFRDSLKQEKDDLIEKCKSIAIKLQQISKSL